MGNKIKRTIERIKKTAEVFTPSWLVNEMIDKLFEYGPEMKEENKTFCDPACGEGNMLVEVLKRKIKLGHNPKNAIKTIYGCDIMEDNIIECKRRLLEIVPYSEEIIDKQIIHLPIEKYKNGSLDYNFEFDTERSKYEKW